MLDLLLLIIGVLLVVFGANYLVDGASSLAKRFNIPDIIIGLTIVAFGTSAPELTVSLFAAFSGSTDIAIGNALGSNIFNVFVILGVAAVIYPVSVHSNTVWKEIPLSLLAALVVGVLANDILLDQGAVNQLSRIDGIVLLCFFSIFMYYVVLVAQQGKDGAEDEIQVKQLSLTLSAVYILLGLVGLVGGGKLLVDNAVNLARVVGMSEAVIGLTIVAAGTSMPELATSAVASLKKNSDIAIGNVVGSNIFNVFFILGTTSTIHTLPFRSEANVDVCMGIFGSVIMFSFTLIGKGRKISRIEGAILITIYIFYLSYLLFLS